MVSELAIIQTAELWEPTHYSPLTTICLSCVPAHNFWPIYPHVAFSPVRVEGGGVSYHGGGNHDGGSHDHGHNHRHRAHRGVRHDHRYLTRGDSGPAVLKE